MATRILSLLLILFTSLSLHAEGDMTTEWPLITFDTNCTEGECIEDNISKYKLLTEVAKRYECLPPEGSTQDQMEEYYADKMLDDSCVRILAKLQEANDWWAQAEATITSHLEAQNVNCDADRGGSDTTEVLSGDVADVVADSEGPAPTCTEEKKAEVKEKNKDELWCIAKATFSMSAVSTIADYLLGDTEEDKNSSGEKCSDFGDNCLYQIASGFGNALMALWEGGKFLAQAAWSGVKNLAVSTWDKIWGNEDKTSTTGLALAEASEDDGVLSALIADPIGSMKNMWDGLMGMLGTWLSDDVFCQKWEGVPHQSECKEPFTSFACMSYGSMIKGGCHIVGWAIAEIVPAFLTGGIVSAVKWGAKAGKALAKAVPISSAVRTALKNSKLAEKVASGVSTVARLRGTQRVIGASRALAATSLNAVRAFMISPSKKFVTQAIDTIKAIASKAGSYKVVQGGGTVLKLGTVPVRYTAKAVWYFFENPMTRKAYNLGTALGPKSIASSGVRATQSATKYASALEASDEPFKRLTQAQDELTVILREQSQGVLTDRGRLDDALKAFDEARNDYLVALKGQRETLAPKLLVEDPKLNLAEVIEELYPELRYADELSTTMSGSAIRKVEVEVQSMIAKIDDPVRRQQLSMEFNHYRSHPTRVTRKIDDRLYFNPEEVYVNARLSPADRSRRGFEIAGINPEKLSADEVLKLKKGIQDAHQIGGKRGAGVYEYSQTEIAQKYRTLREAGFSSTESSNLIRSGIAGDVPKNLGDFSRFNDDLMTELHKLVPEGANPVAYRNFLDKNRRSLDKLVKNGSLRPQDLLFEQFKVLDHPNGQSFAYIKSAEGREFVFRLDGKTMKFFSRDTFLPIDEFVAKNGAILRDGPNGEYLVYGNRYENDIPYMRRTEIKPPVTRAEFEAWRTEIMQKFPSADPEANLLFEKMLSTHRDQILDLFKNGRALPDELTPANIHRVYDAHSDQHLYLFMPKNSETPLSEALFFTERTRDKLDDFSVGRLGLLEQRGIDRTLIFEDGRFVSLKLNDLQMPMLYVGEGAVTRSFLKEHNFFQEMADFANANLKGDRLTEFKTMLGGNRDLLENALVRQQITPADISPNKFKTFRGSDGHSYGLFANEPFGESVVFRLDSTPLEKGIQVGRVKDNLARFGGDLDFSDGSFIRTWKDRNVTKYHYTPKVERDLRYLADDVQRRFDIQTRSGNRLNEEFISVVRDNESILKAAVREGRLTADEIQPSSFYKITSDTGEEFYAFGRVNNGAETVFVPVSKSVTPPNGYLTLDDLHQFGNRFKGSDSSLELIYNADKSVKWSVYNSSYARLGDDAYSTTKLVERSSAPFPEKVAAAELRFKRALTEAEKSALNEALLYGGRKGPGLFDYKLTEVKEIRDILKRGGFSDSETSYLLRSGIAARPPTRFAANTTGIFADDFARMTSRRFDQRINDLEVALQNSRYNGKPLTEAQAKRVRDNIEALYFIDHGHAVSSLQDIVRGKTPLHKSNLYARYNDTGAKAFENFQDVNRWLLEERPEISFQTFKRIQSRFMEGGVENINSRYVGRPRDGGVIGNVTARKPISDEIIAELRSNAYTGFNVNRRLDNGLSTGKIIYPNITDGIKETALARIADSHPTLVDEIRSLQNYRSVRAALDDELRNVPLIQRKLQDQLHALDLRKVELEKIAIRNPSQVEELLQVSSEIDALNVRLASIGDEISRKQAAIKAKIHQADLKHSSIDQSQLQQRLVSALTEERIDWYNKSRAALGPLDSPEKIEKFTDIVAEFQRDLVSIHPFGNGNGRSTRQFALYYPLMKEGLPPPRILDPDIDLFRPLDEWKKEIREGVFASQRLMTDLQERVAAGLPLEESMELMRPLGDYQVNRPMFRVSNRKGAQEWFEGPGLESVNRDQFNYYVRQVIDENPSLLDGVPSDPTAAWDNIHKMAEERYLRNNVLFDHRPKSGNNVVREMSLGMPTGEFKTLFGRSSYDNPYVYQYKMDNWYSDEINWRGLATFKGRPTKTTDDILDMFRELDPHMVSNDILRKGARDPESIRKAALANMEEMEKAVMMTSDETGDIADWARWHSEATDPYYGRSIGYSTSKKESVGKSFGMGAMVNGKFGKVNKTDKVSEYLLPERQARLAQRLNVGTRRSIKDVEIEWMRSLRDDFRYSYGQQREVMGVGAADPDAIMIIKSYDEEGKVIQSFVRNPEKPHEVWIVKGDADPGVRPAEGVEFQTIDLRQPRAPASPAQ